MILCKSDTLMRDIKKQLTRDFDVTSPKGFAEKTIIRLNNDFVRMGINNKKKLFCFVFSYISIPVLLLITGSRFIWLYVIVWWCLINSIMTSYKKKRLRYFGGHLFKLYRFINMELESGLGIGDVIYSLPEAIHDHELHIILEKMSAAWQLTGDLDIAISELEIVFGRHETALFSNNIRQCLLTGVTGKSFVQMENLLFSRYVDHIKQISRRLQGSLIICSVFALMPLMISMLWPVLAEMLKALESIFSR